MKKKIVTVIAALLAVVAVFAQGGNETSGAGYRSVQKSSAKLPKFITVGTASAGGAYYPVGIAIADVLTNNLGVQASAQVTGGAVENNTLVNEKTVDLAITMNGTAYAAVHGTKPYTAPMSNIKALCNGVSEGVFHVVTLKKTGITKMTDLKGKNVVMGPAGGGAINMATAIWEAYGFSVDDVNPTYVSYTDGVSALKDGKVDAVLVQSAAPAAALQELCATNGKDVVFIPVEEEMAKKIVADRPYYAYKALSKDIYGADSDTLVVYQPNLVICRADLDDDVVYEITRSIMENVDKISASNPTARNFSREGAAKNLSIDLHPGAERYYKEVGLL